jgi:cell shape-determining protein MreD
MIKNVWQIIIFFLLISFLSLFQFSFINTLVNPLRQLNLVLFFLIFVLFFIDLKISLVAALIFGIWLDILSFYFFGFYLLLFFITLIIAQGILKKWLTNRSLYTLLVLMMVLSIIYNLLASMLIYLVGVDSGNFFLFNSNFWLNLIYQIIWGFLSALIFFNIANLVSKRIKPFFLEKKRYL